MSDYYTEEAEYFRQKIEFEKSFEDTYGVTFDRIRELAEAEREGRINISQYPNCGMCKWEWRGLQPQEGAKT